MKKKDSLLKSTGLFSVATLMSRILGLIRDSFIAAYIPHVWQDIFWAGFKIPATFRTLFAEGVLSTAFIPLLTRVLARESEEDAIEAAAAVFRALALTVMTAVTLGILFAPLYVPYLLQFPGDDSALFPGLNWRMEAGVWATQVLFPFLFFIALAAWAMGVLNTYRIFFVSAIAPTLFNLSLILGCLLGAKWMNLTGFSLMTFMMGSVIIGGILQFAIQIPSVCRIRYFPPRWASPFHPKVWMFLRMLAPSIFGLAIYQINSIISQTYFASQYGKGGISQMNYAFRLIQFPLGVIGVALATASFPRIAQYFEQDRMEDASKTFVNVMKYMLLIMIPSSAGLIVLGSDIVRLIYDHGHFHEQQWLMPTLHVLIMYSIGIVFYGAVKVLARTFQARHNFRTPVVIGAISVACNIVLCAWFVHRQWPLWSLALSSSIASAVQTLLLIAMMRIKIPQLPLLFLLDFSARVFLASAGMALACWGVLKIIPLYQESFLGLSARVAMGVTVGIGAYLGLGWLLFRGELLAILRKKQ
ncbi:MAG: murein biosynthesis integral membrane protein MurJ [Candidatus Omnitrophica bacterium]|nr:murein biosynthesis integral membrane protein MurJ [Candidatus Omnitrophota bacterium]